MRLPCISLWQPWASAMGHAKHNETRHWPAPRPLVGKRWALHAAKRPMTADERDLIAQVRCLGGLDLTNVPYGAIVCTAVLMDCHEVPAKQERFYDPFDEDFPSIWLPPKDPLELLLGNYAAGRFAWQFDQFEFLPVPVPTIGRQRIWHVELEVSR